MGKRSEMGLASPARRVALPAALLAVAVALAMAASLLPSAAFGYFVFGTVSVQPGASYLSVEAGRSASTSVAVTPASDSQTLGCGMAGCPQICEGDGAIEAGYSCFDANGQCTCNGPDYYTYYPEVSVSSSNNGVATAYMSGGTLVVVGNAAGSASITVTASLRQWNSSSTTVQVNVTAPVGSAGSSGSAAGGSSAGSLGGDEAGGAAAVPQEAVGTQSRDDALNETVVETVLGTKVYSVENNAYLNTAEELAKIAGTEDQCVIWSGASSENPDYSWTFHGDDVDAQSPYLEFDPTITVSSLGTGTVANLMEQAKDGVVLEFSHEGQLPGTATVYVNVEGAFSDGAELSLYCFNVTERCFELQQEGLTVEGGYASFELDHCSTWALSTDDLASYSVQEVNTPGAVAASGEPIAQDADMAPIIVAAVIGAVVVIAAVVAIAVRRKRAHALDDAPKDNGSADAANDRGEEADGDATGSPEEPKAPNSPEA